MSEIIRLYGIGDNEGKDACVGPLTDTPHVQAAIVAEMGVLSGVELEQLGMLCKKLGLQGGGRE